jgi:hypothetical protein
MGRRKKEQPDMGSEMTGIKMRTQMRDSDLKRRKRQTMAKLKRRTEWKGINYFLSDLLPYYVILHNDRCALNKQN